MKVGLFDEKLRFAAERGSVRAVLAQADEGVPFLRFRNGVRPIRKKAYDYSERRGG